MTALLTYLFGFAVAALVGSAHHFALAGILKIAPHDGTHARSVVVVTFVALLALHSAEILGLAALNAALIGGFPGAFAEGPPGFTDVVYVTGIAFSTLGYASIDAAGAFRLILMFEALLGFMLLTWSATFLFSACQKSWQQDEG